MQGEGSSKKTDLYQLEAIVDMTRGTDKINSISDFGPGSSKTQATYWLLTRPLESLSSEAIASVSLSVLFCRTLAGVSP
eukprot:scaffold2660_cov257-Pinguiococcus_pyrenoidosus.AAC.14